MSKGISHETREASVDVIVRERLAMLAMLSVPDSVNVSRVKGLTSIVGFIDQNVAPEVMTEMSEEASRLVLASLQEEI